MKRAGKVALLTKVIQGTNTQTTRQLLQHYQAKAPRSLILIDNLDCLDCLMADTDNVHFQDRGKQHIMTLGEAQRYANRYGIGTLFVIPAKRAI
jgi:hypothetical protein